MINRFVRQTTTLVAAVAVVALLRVGLLGGDARESREWYVAPGGSAANVGSIDRPLDLPTALDGRRVRSGSTVWLRGGVYRGPFKSYLAGTPQAPITVRQYPGERAILADDRGRADGATLHVFGEWTVYRDFEVTNTNDNRRHDREFRPAGLEVQAPNTKFINLVIHDTGMGFGFWKESVDSELYGNVIFNSGTENVRSDMRHGHALYTQNESGTKWIRDNIMVNGYGFGIHAYPNPGGLAGFHFEGNVVADSGSSNPGAATRYNNVIVSGYKPYQADRVELIENFTYQSAREILDPRFSDANVCLGCSDPQTHKRIVVRNNYFAGGTPVAIVSGWQDVIMKGNTFVGSGGMVAAQPPTGARLSAWLWDDNTYI